MYRSFRLLAMRALLVSCAAWMAAPASADGVCGVFGRARCHQGVRPTCRPVPVCPVSACPLGVAALRGCRASSTTYRYPVGWQAESSACTRAVSTSRADFRVGAPTIVIWISPRPSHSGFQPAWMPASGLSNSAAVRPISRDPLDVFCATSCCGTIVDPAERSACMNRCRACNEGKEPSEFQCPDANGDCFEDTPPPPGGPSS